MATTLCDISVKFTENILDEIIRNAGGSHHTAWKFIGGIKKGDNYITETFRFLITGVTSNGKAIEIYTYVKSLPKNLAWRKTFRSTEFSRNECQFFDHVVQKYLQLLNGQNLEQFNIFPECLKNYSDGENDFIVLKDLGIDGYQSPARQIDFNFPICKLLMETLGTFHGLSFVLKHRQPDEFHRLTTTTIQETYYPERYRDWYAPVLRDQINVAQDAIRREYPDTMYEKRVRKFLDNNFYDKMIALVNYRSQYSVLSHGDCWIMNFLIKYNGTEPIDAKVIDFQLARYGSPALDLTFFIYSCTTQTLREAYYKQLLQAYHNSLSKLLVAFECDPNELFPYSALMNELRECGRYGIGMAMESVPLSMLDETDVLDLNTFDGGEAVPMDHMWKYRPIDDDVKRRRFAELFKHAIDQGYL